MKGAKVNLHSKTLIDDSVTVREDLVAVGVASRFDTESPYETSSVHGQGITVLQHK